jgi:hypothetical protein
MQGMSGSPVYIDGKLIGAVAMAFPFSKEAIAGIRPIADMLGVADNPRPKPQYGSTKQTCSPRYRSGTKLFSVATK